MNFYLLTTMIALPGVFLFCGCFGARDWCLSMEVPAGARRANLDWRQPWAARSMIVYLAILAIQVMLVIDVIRNGRNQLWIMALMFLPGPSTIAYLVIEVYPRLQGNRHVRTARAKAVAALDPEREVQAARDALDLADTAANRIRLADALANLGRYAEALPLLREAIERGPVDMRTGEKLARAEFETGDPAEALTVLDAE